MRGTAALVGGALLVAVLGGCGGGSSPQAEEDTGTLAVTIRRGGSPVSNALMVATASREGAAPTRHLASSDDSGVARLSGLDPGVYSVTASRSVGANLFTKDAGTLVVSKGTVSKVSVELTDAGADYFPLARGNEWTFDSMTLAVETTKRIRSVTAFALARTGGGRPFYCARGINEVYCLGIQRADRTDQIYWPAEVFFSTTPGENLSTLPDWGTVTVVSRDATVAVPAGEFARCIELELAHDGVKEYWYLAPGVGPCMIEIFGIGGAVAQLTDYVLH